jgi:PAS domain S-box-containing protein
LALEGSGLGEWDWNLRTNRMERNERWAEMLGYTLHEIEASLQQGVDLQHPDDREGAWLAIQDHLAGKTESYSASYRMRTKSGSYKWIRDCGKIMERDDRGNPVRLCGTHADLDEEKKAEERIRSLLAEKELILKEVHHRIKNNMNTMRDLLLLQAGNAKDDYARSALEDAEKRLMSMSLLYEKLYHYSDYSEVSITDYLPILIDEIVAGFPNNAIVETEKRFQDFKLDARRMQALGILVNELLTNIMKYAFAEREHGRIRVGAMLENDTVIVTVQDDGSGLPEAVSFDDSPGFGLQLVRALTEQLDGRIRVERGSGTKVVLEFKH